MDIAWIDTTDALAAWAERLDGRALAVDTEADSFHHYHEKVCLVQLSAGDRHALLDPLAAIDLVLLSGPFSDPSLRKILHGADYDVRLLARDFGLVVSGLYDTMIAARLLGEPALGLAALLEKYLGVTLDKTQQRADWSKRPLSLAMRDYAVEDTRHLEALEAILCDRLDGLGRSAWAREECERLERVTWRDRREDDPESFRKTKGARALDRAGLAVLKEVWAWRDATSRRRDKPHFRVLHDETLLALAKNPPASVGDLTRIPGFPSSLVRSPAALAIVEAAQRGVACLEADRPALGMEVRVPPEPELVARIARIRAGRDLVARELELDPSVLVSRATIEAMAKRWESGEDPFGVTELRQWQIDLLRPGLT